MAFFPWTLTAQFSNDMGMPLIRNFTPDDYSAHPQNWAIVQDSRGMMYFGNGSGILEFDGKNWTLIPVSNNIMSRSLAIDGDGNLYYGGARDFGRLTHDADGKWRTVSLAERLKPEDRDFNDVWKAFAAPQGVYFLTGEKIFRFHENRIDVIPASLGSRFGFLIDGQLLLVMRKGGLSAIQGNDILPIPGSSLIRFAQDNFIAAAPYAERKILVANQKGDFFLLDLGIFYDADSRQYDFRRQADSSILIPYSTEAAALIRAQSGMIYNITRLDDDRFALGTVNAGLFLIHGDGSLIQAANKASGLADNDIHDIFLDSRRNLWTALNNGLSYIEANPSLTQFNSRNGLPDYLISVTRHQGRIYAGGFNGLFSLSEDRPTGKTGVPSFAQLARFPLEWWDFLVYNDMLFAATRSGVYQINGTNLARICDQAYVLCLGKSGKHPGHVFLGLQGGLGVLKLSPPENRAGHPRFSFLGKYKDIPNTVRKITEDGEGNLWISTETNGIIFLKFTGNDPFQYQATRFGMDRGLPAPEWNFVHVLKGRLLVATTRGIYTVEKPAESTSNPQAIRFIPENTFGRPFLDPPTVVSNILVNRAGDFIINSNQGIYRIREKSDGSFDGDRTPFRKIPNTDLDVYQDSREVLWIPTNKGLFRYDPSVPKDYDVPFNALIRKITVGQNKMLFPLASDSLNRVRKSATSAVSGALTRNLNPVFNYRDNSIDFEYSAAFYEPSPGIQFKCMLEGFDKGWINWTPETKREYTNLPEGRYVFRLIARNIYERQSRPAAFRFSIKPPWFRTWPAYLGYVVFGSLFLVGTLKLYTLRLRREKTRLEKLVALRTQELKEASLTDPLTGLRNRRYITEVLKEEVRAFVNFKKHLAETKDRRSQTDQDTMIFGVFLFDIDHFKEVNDLYGHEAGDIFLKDFASLLKSSVRSDDVVTRIGGEEFLIVLKKTQPDYLDDYSGKIMAKIREISFKITGDASVNKTCSIGYTAYPIYADEPELIDFEHAVKIADLGLYYAKHNGRNLAVRILPTDVIPREKEEIRRMATSLDYAMNYNYLKIKT